MTICAETCRSVTKTSGLAQVATQKGCHRPMSFHLDMVAERGILGERPVAQQHKEQVQHTHEQQQQHTNTQTHEHSNTQTHKKKNEKQRKQKQQTADSRQQTAASLPFGCLSSSTCIRRLQSVSIIRPVDAGSPWAWKGRTMSNSVLVRFYVAEEGNDAGFDVRGQDVHLTSQSLVGHEDLGELLPTSASLDHRTERELETTVDDARRVRQIPDVHHISQR